MILHTGCNSYQMCLRYHSWLVEPCFYISIPCTFGYKMFNGIEHVLNCVIIDLTYCDVGMESISNETESLGEMVEFANK